MSHALVENGIVVNVIVWDGVTLLDLPESLSLVAVPADANVSIGHAYDAIAEHFTAPPAPPALRPTAADVLAQRDALLALATVRIAPLQDAVDLNVETGDDVAALTEWKQYRVDLNRIEQQAGFPGDVEWPAAPQ